MKQADIFDASSISFVKGAYQGRTHAKRMIKAIGQTRQQLETSLALRDMADYLWQHYHPKVFPGLDDLGQAGALICRLAIEVVDNNKPLDEAIEEVEKEADKLSP